MFQEALFAPSFSSSLDFLCSSLEWAGVAGARVRAGLGRQASRRRWEPEPEPERVQGAALGPAPALAHGLLREAGCSCCSLDSDRPRFWFLPLLSLFPPSYKNAGRSSFLTEMS